MYSVLKYRELPLLSFFEKEGLCLELIWFAFFIFTRSNRRVCSKMNSIKSLHRVFHPE